MTEDTKTYNGHNYSGVQLSACVNGYKQGWVDAIDKMMEALNRDWKYVNKDSVIATYFICGYMEKLKKLKEQKE